MAERRVSEVGYVVSAEGGSVEVRFDHGDACAKCGMCKRRENGAMGMIVADAGHLDVGQRVRVTFPYRSIWIQSFFVFVLPLLLLLAGVAAALAVSKAAALGDLAKNLLPPAAAAVALGAGLFLAVVYERRFRRRMSEGTTIEPEESA